MVSKNEELTITEQCALLEINRQTLYYKPADKTEKLNEDEYIMKKSTIGTTSTVYSDIARFCENCGVRME